jgi:hypothetical protein
MAANVSATPEQIAKVFEVLKGFMPNGAMIEKIRHETSYDSDIIWSALDTLEREGKIEGRSPFAYDANAVDPEDPEK